MDVQEELNQAKTMLATAIAAYQKALSTPAFTQSNNRRVGRHPVTDLLASVTYWRKEVNRLTALAGGGSAIRSGLAVSLRPRV